MLSAIVCILSIVVLGSVGYSYIVSLRVRRLEEEVKKIESTVESIQKPKPKTIRKTKV